MLGDVIYEALQLAGILAFALSGALVGVRRNLDILGVVVVGAATGTGGGILRDILLGVHPPVSFLHWPNLVVAVAGSLVVFFVHPRLTRIRRFEVVFDAFGLGLFSANGAALALPRAASAPITSVLVGTIAAIGGGVIRDVLVDTVPGGAHTRALRGIGAARRGLAVAVVALGGGVIAGSLVGGTTAIVLRLTSVARGWHLPRPKFAPETGKASPDAP